VGRRRAPSQWRFRRHPFREREIGDLGAMSRAPRECPGIAIVHSAPHRLSVDPAQWRTRHVRSRPLPRSLEDTPVRPRTEGRSLLLFGPMVTHSREIGPRTMQQVAPHSTSPRRRVGIKPRYQLDHQKQLSPRSNKLPRPTRAPSDDPVNPSENSPSPCDEENLHPPEIHGEEVKRPAT